jgi:hypothetical protein
MVVYLNSRVVQDQNNHNSKNQKQSLNKELYECYCLSLYRRWIVQDIMFTILRVNLIVFH